MLLKCCCNVDLVVVEAFFLKPFPHLLVRFLLKTELVTLGNDPVFTKTGPVPRQLICEPNRSGPKSKLEARF